MARKKTQPVTAETDSEAIPTQEVEAVHTVKYKQPMRVPIEVPPDLDEPATEEDEDFDLEEIEIEEEKPKRRTPSPTFRNKIKQKFLDRGIGGGELIALRIDQLPNYGVDGVSGINAEKIFCDAVKVTEDYFDNDSYLSNILRKFGPGDYWLTARVKNSIVHNWLERIGAPSAAAPQTTRTEGEVYSASGQMPFYSPPQAPPAPQKSFVEQIEEFARISTALNKIQGRSDANAAQNPPAPAPVPEDIQLASILMKDPDIKAKAIKGLLGTAGQDTDITSLLIENGPALLKAAGEMLQGVIQQAVIGIDHIRSQNGQAQTGIPAHQNGSGPNNGNWPQAPENPETSAQQAMGAIRGGFSEGGPRSENVGTNATSPEDQILDSVITQCARKTPIKVVADRIFETADKIRAEAPLESIDQYIEDFANAPLDGVIAFVGTVPGAQEVLDMPHAKDWIAGLQEEVKRQISQGGEDEE